MQKMSKEGDGVFAGTVPIQMLQADPASADTKPLQNFHIVQHKLHSRCVHPDKAECSAKTVHKTVMDGKGQGFAWVIGKVATDKAQENDNFTVKLTIQQDGFKKVTWDKEKKT